MGWSEPVTRASTLLGFEAALHGWMKANGHDPGPDTSPEAVARLDELMERYPDD